VIGRRHTGEDDIMGELSKLPNIGKAAERSLENAGIFTPEELRALGSKKAFWRVKSVEPGACLNRLYALEGAVQDVRKSELSEEKKKELRDFFNSL